MSITKRRVELQALRNAHCKPWQLEQLFIQRSLIRQSFASLGQQIATRLANQWARDVILQWPTPYPNFVKPPDLPDRICLTLCQFGLANVREHVHNLRAKAL